MLNFHNIIITFEHVQVNRLTIIFHIFLYFPSHKISVNRFPSHYSSMLCLHRLSFIYGFVGRKNHKNTKYMHIFNLLFLYTKNMGIYIIPVNYDLYIIWSQPAIYTEVQLYTTRKVVNCMNDIQIMFYNLLLFLHSWIAFLFIITMINYMFIVRYFNIKQLHLILGQIFIWGYEKELWEWIIYNCFEMLQKMIFFSILSAMICMNANLIYILSCNNYYVHVFCFLRCASSRNINNFKMNTLITCIMIIHMKICYTGSLYTGTDIIYIEVAYFNMPFMSLGPNFIIYVSLGFTIIIIKIVCIFIIVLNILFVCKFIIVQNVLFDNYLHYCINAPFDYNCMNVLSSALYLIDLYVLHVLLYSMVQVSFTCTERKSLWGGGEVEFFISFYPP